MRAAYDYVIVSAGSAGCVLAARLTEDPHVRVRVIEAGAGLEARRSYPGRLLQTLQDDLRLELHHCSPNATSAAARSTGRVAPPRSREPAPTSRR